jgi:aspartate aminotransferase
VKPVAARLADVTPSATVRLAGLVAEMRARGEPVISFSVGEPDFPTPRHIVAAAQRALDEGHTKYTPSPGIPPLREAIAERVREDNGIPASPNDVLVAPTKHTLFMACAALVDPGDEVVLPDPAWVSYVPMIRLAGGVPVRVRADEGTDFQLDPDAVQAAITPRTKAVVVNSPSNPAGAVHSLEAMRALADVVQDHDLYLISDEIYEKLVYDGRHVSPASLDGMFERTVTASGFSKTYAMTGWRLGWLVAPPPLFDAVAKLQAHTITCAPAFAQVAGVAALRGPEEELRRMREEFRTRRDLMVRLVHETPHLSCPTPQGAFYVFPRFDLETSSASLAEGLLREAKVATVPGRAFGPAGEGHLRLSYAASQDAIREGMGRLRDALEAR